MSSASSELVRRLAWRGALVAACLNPVGMLLDVSIGRSVAGMPWWQAVVASLIGVAVAATLLLWRSASARVSSLLFLVCTIASAAALCISSSHYATLGAVWVPFQANKLSVLTVAMLAPEAWSGVVAIALYAGTAIVQLELFDPAIRAHLAQGEPMAMIAFAVFALGLLALRQRHVLISKELVRTKAEALAAARIKDLSLSVRDLANTPIQSIAFAAALLRAEHPELGTVLDRIDRAVARLRDLNETLAQQERQEEKAARPPNQ